MAASSSAREAASFSVARATRLRSAFAMPTPFATISGPSCRRNPQPVSSFLDACVINHPRVGVLLDEGRVSRTQRYARVPLRECRGGRQTIRGQGGVHLGRQGRAVVIPGSKTTTRTLLENQDAVGVSGTWAATVVRSFLDRLLHARDIVDVQIAAGAALQDLDEWAGTGQRGEPSPEADLG